MQTLIGVFDMAYQLGSTEEERAWIPQHRR